MPLFLVWLVSCTFSIFCLIGAIMKLIFIFLPLFATLPAIAKTCKPLPALFEDHRIYLEIALGQNSLKFYTDSGGGLFPFIYEDTAQKLEMKWEQTVHEGDLEIGLSTFPTALLAQHIPLSSAWEKQVRIFKSGQKSEANEIRFMIGDGFFGASLFAEKIWHFDYTQKKLESCDTIDSLEKYQSASLFFKEMNGHRTSHQPRMSVIIDGVTLPVLFDTGATSLYSTEAIAKLQLNKPFAASSFVRESIARKWISKHPEWRVLKNGEKFAGGGDLIEVPRITLGSYTVGPVWFATRRDEIYDRYSKDLMDTKIDGALGGNALKFFEIFADYPRAKIYFKKSRQ